MINRWIKPTFNSPDEERFCHAWLKERMQVMNLVVTMLGIATHLGAICLLPLFVHPDTTSWFLGMHAGLFLLNLTTVACWKLGIERGVTATAFSAAVLLVLAYDVLLVAVTTRVGATPDIMWTIMGVMAYAPFAVALIPSFGLLTSSAALLMTVAGAYAFSQTPAGLIGSGIFVIYMVALIELRGYQDRRAYREARREFLFRSRIAPAHIIRHALINGAELDSVFKPEVKFCVCISSDWRNYQELSAGMTSTQLSGALAAYYDLCQALLQECLPDGNFYSDWIADELFVVVFDAKNAEGGDSALVQQAVAFGSRLVVAKEAFCREHGLPRAIDVGIAAGPALLGIMGPAAHRKVTALGETPGRSRRLQTAGKLLRNHCGAHDRVVFGADVLMKLRGDYDVRHYRVDGSTKVRDVHDPDLYYLEPEAQPDALNKVA